MKKIGLFLLVGLSFFLSLFLVWLVSNRLESQIWKINADSYCSEKHGLCLSNKPRWSPQFPKLLDQKNFLLVLNKIPEAQPDKISQIWVGPVVDLRSISEVKNVSDVFQFVTAPMKKNFAVYKEVRSVQLVYVNEAIASSALLYIQPAVNGPSAFMELYVFVENGRSYSIAYYATRDLYEKNRADAMKIINSLDFFLHYKDSFSGFEWDVKGQTYTNPYYGLKIKKKSSWGQHFSKFNPFSSHRQLLVFLCHKNGIERDAKLILEIPEVNSSEEMYTAVRYAMVLANRFSSSKDKILSIQPIEEVKINNQIGARLHISLLNKKDQPKAIEIYIVMHGKQAFKLIYQADSKSFDACYEDAKEMIQSFEFFKKSS